MYIHPHSTPVRKHGRFTNCRAPHISPALPSKPRNVFTQVCFRTSKLQTQISSLATHRVLSDATTLLNTALTSPPPVHTYPLGKAAGHKPASKPPPSPFPNTQTWSGTSGSLPDENQPGPVEAAGQKLSSYRILVWTQSPFCSAHHLVFLLQTKLTAAGPHPITTIILCLPFCLLFPVVFCSTSPCLSPPTPHRLHQPALCVFPNSFSQLPSLSPCFLQPGPDPVSLCSNAETALPRGADSILLSGPFTTSDPPPHEEFCPLRKVPRARHLDPSQSSEGRIP